VTTEDVSTLGGYWKKDTKEQIKILEEARLQQEKMDEYVTVFLALEVHHAAL
jgi:hypothetical protein